MHGQIADSSIDCTTADGASQLEASIQRQFQGRILGLRVRVGSKGLVLLGNAHTYYIKQLVQQAVMEATSEPILANEIEVV
jgi:hypothetical protein